MAADYTDSTALAAWLGSDQALPSGMDESRVITRASRVVDRLVTAPYSTDAEGLPIDADYLQALDDACCAVVEYWLAAGGEDVDRVALTGPIDFDGVQLGAAPSWYPPRAAEILRQAGLRGGPGAN